MLNAAVCGDDGSDQSASAHIGRRELLEGRTSHQTLSGAEGQRPPGDFPGGERSASAKYEEATRGTSS